MQRFNDLVLQLQAALLDLDLRQPALRKKLGPLADTQAKLAQALYELSLTEGTLLRAGVASFAEGAAPEGGGGRGEGDDV